MNDIFGIGLLLLVTLVLLVWLRTDVGFSFRLGAAGYVIPLNRFAALMTTTAALAWGLAFFFAGRVTGRF